MLFDFTIYPISIGRIARCRSLDNWCSCLFFCHASFLKIRPTSFSACLSGIVLFGGTLCGFGYEGIGRPIGGEVPRLIDNIRSTAVYYEKTCMQAQIRSICAGKIARLIRATPVRLLETKV
jgi:hypothetical protein